MGDIIYTTIYYANNKPDLTLSWNQLLDDSEKARLPIYFGDVNCTAGDVHFSHVCNPSIQWQKTVKTSNELEKLPKLNPNQTTFKATLCCVDNCQSFTKIFSFEPIDIVTISRDHDKLELDLTTMQYRIATKHLLNAALTTADMKDLNSISICQVKSALHNADFIRCYGFKTLSDTKHNDMLLATRGVFYHLDLHYPDRTASKIVGFNFASK